MRAPIKVLVVDDSALIRQMLTRALTQDPTVEVVGTAKTGLEAIEKAISLQPDVITLDIEMPELTGLEALPHLIKTSPARVVILSALSDSEITYQALDHGATDFMVKPSGGVATRLSDLVDELLKKIKTAYRIPPERRTLVRDTRLAPVARASTFARGTDGRLDKLVAIGASTGGPPALETVFSGLTSELPASYVVVQHLPAGFSASLARRLARVTDLEVVEAEDGMPIEQGVAYLAPYGLHMRVGGVRSKRVMLEDAPSMHGVRPAVDPLMTSVAEHFGARSVGVVLTGMGADGAKGLGAIKTAGGDTVAQDEETSVVWGMPGAAVRLGAAAHVVPIGSISTEIRRAVRG